MYGYSKCEIRGILKIVYGVMPEIKKLTDTLI